jgi:Ran GTPase-activating protein (RanGAP) involved in mRNA processing and transport
MMMTGDTSFREKSPVMRNAGMYFASRVVKYSSTLKNDLRQVTKELISDEKMEVKGKEKEKEKESDDDEKKDKKYQSKKKKEDDELEKDE